MAEEEKKEKKTTSRKSTKKDEPKEEKKTTRKTSTRKSTKKKEPEEKLEGEKLADPGEHPEAEVKPISEHMDMDKTVAKPITMSDLPQKERLSEEEIDEMVKEEEAKIFTMKDVKKPTKEQKLKGILKRKGMITTRDI